MMSLTLPLAPDAAEHAAGDPSNFVTIGVNLLPDEVVVARRARRLRRRVLGGLAVLLALILGGYVLSSWQTHQARADLSAAQQRGEQLQQQQHRYDPLIEAQGRSAEINTTLRTLMADDVQWSALLHTLRSKAPHGVTIASLSATLVSTADGSSGNADGSGPGVLNQSGRTQVGTLAITGTGPDQDAIARYVDALARVHGLAVPLPANISGDKGAKSFSINVIITTDALGDRYTASAATGTTEGD